MPTQKDKTFKFYYSKQQKRVLTRYLEVIFLKKVKEILGAGRIKKQFFTEVLSGPGNGFVESLKNVR